MKLSVKDRVILNGTNRVGIIVQLISSGKYKILWDDDWKSGRTYVHNRKEVSRIES